MCTPHSHPRGAWSQLETRNTHEAQALLKTLSELQQSTSRHEAARFQTRQSPPCPSVTILARLSLPHHTRTRNPLPRALSMTPFPRPGQTHDTHKIDQTVAGHSLPATGTQWRPLAAQSLLRLFFLSLSCSDVHGRGGPTPWSGKNKSPLTRQNPEPSLARSQPL